MTVRGGRFGGTRAYTSIAEQKLHNQKRDANTFSILSNDCKSFNSYSCSDLDVLSDLSGHGTNSSNTTPSSVACTPYAIGIDNSTRSNRLVSRHSESGDKLSQLTRQNTVYRDALGAGGKSGFRNETLVSEYVTVDDIDGTKTSWDSMENCSLGYKTPGIGNELKISSQEIADVDEQDYEGEDDADDDDDDVAKTPNRRLKHATETSNSDTTTPLSYLDGSLSLEGFKCLDLNKPVSMFWLPNNEVYALPRVPSIASLKQGENTEKLYFVFTPVGIDIIQDVSYLKNVATRRNHTPFVVVYSYNLNSNYFRVVPRIVDARDHLTLFDSSNVEKVTSRGNPQLDRLNSVHYDVAGIARTRGNSVETLDANSSADADTSGEASSEQESNEKTYVFYRAYLPHIDNDGKSKGDISGRLRIHISKYKSTLGHKNIVRRQHAQSTRDDGVIRHKYNRCSSIDTPSQYITPKHSVMSSHSSVAKSDDKLAEADAYSASNGNSAAAVTLGSDLELPDVLATECKRLAGFESVQNKMESNQSIANFRLESMIKRNFSITSQNEKHIICDDPKIHLKGAFGSDNTNVLFTVGNVKLCDGDVVKIRIPTIYRGHYEYDSVRLYDRTTLVKCFKAIKGFAGNLKSDVPSSVAQYCPNIFWNLALYGDVDVVLSELCPALVETVRKRKRTIMEPYSSPETPSYSYKRVREAEANINHYSDNNFITMQSIFDRDARTKIEKMLEIRKSQNAVIGKTNRKLFLKNLDAEDLIATVLDENCFLKISMQLLSDFQKKLVYQEYLLRDYFAPIHIDSAREKGRGVYAAFELAKDDFVVEYKGELVTGKSAKSRDDRYSKTKLYKGSFVFHFKHDGHNYCIDATEEDINYGPARLINHSKRNPNLVAKALTIQGIPRLFFVAKRAIKWGEELLVDYGERDPEIIKDNPWLLN